MQRSIKTLCTAVRACGRGGCRSCAIDEQEGYDSPVIVAVCSNADIAETEGDKLTSSITLPLHLSPSQLPPSCPRGERRRHRWRGASLCGHPHQRHIGRALKEQHEREIWAAYSGESEKEKKQETLTLHLGSPLGHDWIAHNR
jgi:hypothetical protein